MQIGPYTIERELGRGGMGAVYLGREAANSPAVAVKVIHANLASNPELAARFEREGAALERLNHPNLVSLVGRGTQRGGLWLAMEFVKGVSLDEHLKTGGPWPSHAAGELLFSLCEGIAHAHEAGLLHRDLKPANVLLRALDGQPLIVDFGLTLPLDVSQHLTQTGEILGSPGYLAPEQCGLGEPASPATDVYGLGALLYSVLTGEPPLRGASILATLDQVLNVAPRPPSELVPGVDPGLERVCLRCLAKDPSERYRDARELQQALLGEPTKPPPSRAPLGLALAALTLLGVGALAFAGSSPPETNPSPRASALSSGSPRASSPSPAPTSPAPDSGPRTRGTDFELALAAEEWDRAREQLHGFPDSERPWQRYRLLAAELDATGEAKAPWRAIRSEGVEEAQALCRASGASASDTWLRALEPLLLTLRDPYLGAPPKRELSQVWLTRIREALDSGPTRPLQTRALLRAAAEIRVGLVDPVTKEGLAEARAALEALAKAEGMSWQTALWKGRLATFVRDWPTLFEALAEGELAALRSGHPWALSTFHDLRNSTPDYGLRILKPEALLAEAVLQGRGPPSLKFRAALRVSAYELQENQPARACALLNEHPPAEGTSFTPHKARARTLLAGYLAQGDPRSALEVLERLEVRRPGWKRDPTFVLLEAVALAQLGRPNLSLLDSVSIPTDQSLASLATSLVYVQAAVHSSSPRHLEEALRRVRESEEPVISFLAWEVLEKALARGLEDVALARRASRGLADELKPLSEQLVATLLEGGDWKTAIRALRKVSAPARPADTDAFVRATYRALKRGLQDATSGSSEWQSAYDDCRALAAENGASPLSLGLLESLSSLTRKRRGELISLFEEGIRTQPGWEEFAEGRARLFQESIEDDWSERHLLRGQLRGATRSWSQDFPESAEAKLAMEVVFKEPQWRNRLRALAQGSGPSSELAERALIAQALDNFREGLIPAGESKQGLMWLASSGSMLSKTRRDLLLAMAEVEARTPSHAVEALALLSLCEAWAGRLDKSSEDVGERTRARFLVLVALSEARLGNAVPAAEAAGRAKPLLKLLQPPERALAQARLARVECLLNPGLTLERLIELYQPPLAAAPSLEAFRLFARSSTGGKQQSAFAAALSFPMAEATSKQLLREIEALGHDPSAVARAALPLIEARASHQPLALGLARALFLEEMTRDRATLLWEAFRIDSRCSLGRTRVLMEEAGDLLGKARRLLSSEAEAILLVEDKLLARIARSYRSERRPGDLARELEASLLELSREIETSDLSDRLRLPLVQSAVHQRLATLVPKERETQQRKIEELFRKWALRPYTCARIRLWSAGFRAELGDYETAGSILNSAKVPLALPEVRATQALQSAGILVCLGKESEALGLLGFAASISEDPTEITKIRLLEATLYSRAKQHPPALAAARRAMSLCPQGPAFAGLWLEVQRTAGKAQARAGRTQTARNLLDAVRRSPALAASSNLEQSRFFNLESSVLGGEEEWERALAAAEQAVTLGPTLAEGHLTRAIALVALGRKPKAFGLIEAQLENKAMVLGDRLRLKRWLAEERAR